MVLELGSYVEGSIDPMTHTSTPKSMEEVATKVMKVDKVVELFHTMVIVSLNMGNLILEVKHFEGQIGYRGKGKGNVIGGIR
jgi:hypothetical protein